MKKYSLQVGETFTQQKADELIEYFSAIKDDLMKIQWNPQGTNARDNNEVLKVENLVSHIWELNCFCDGCKKNTEIQEVVNSI